MLGFKQLIGMVIVLICVVLGLVFWIDYDAQNEIENIKLDYVDLNTVKDGIYEATVESELVNAKVRVIVENNTLIDVALLEHRHGLGYSSESIVDSMIEENRVDVDVISGSTLSSKIIKQAVNKALISGK